jgi:hypothetical protein
MAASGIRWSRHSEGIASSHVASSRNGEGKASRCVARHQHSKALHWHGQAWCGEALQRLGGASHGYAGRGQSKAKLNMALIPLSRQS